jgi:hypothetical protein
MTQSNVFNTTPIKETRNHNPKSQFTGTGNILTWKDMSRESSETKLGGVKRSSALNINAQSVKEVQINLYSKSKSNKLFKSSESNSLNTIQSSRY